MTVVSKAKFAEHIGVSRPAVTKMCNSGRIPVRSDGKINLEEAVVAYESSKQIGREASKQNGKKGGKKPANTKAKSKAPPKRKAQPVELDQPDDDEPITTGGMTQKTLTEQFNKAKLAEKTYQAKLKEMEYKKARGELLEISEVREDAKRVAEDIRGKLLAIPQKLAQQIVDKTPREAQRMLEEAINKALTALHKSKFTKEQ